MDIENKTTTRDDFGVDNFQENGFAVCPAIITESEASNALDQIRTHFGNDRPLEELQGNDRFKIHLFLSELSRIVHHPTLIQAVRQALQTESIALWSSDLNIKAPNSKQYFSEHQDATYTGLQPAHRGLTVWVALSDPVGIQEGCLSFLRGSHKLGQLPHFEEDDGTTNNNNGDNMLSRGQRVLYDPQTLDSNWISLPLRAGEATLHHFYTIHKSGHNLHPTKARVGLALRYIAHDVRQTGPVRECITWIDDDTDDGTSNAAKRQLLMSEYFDLEPRLPTNPSDADIQRGKEAHDEAMRREASNYFHDSSTAKAYDG
ncbi:Phytanoyl-CoA dioxygenase (PhyH) [Seminavis robusta]|uniref:Phytanoyl-CoA dioxygenase (PhyH) n=1 Tax=Seminavis robusta TaxID=568900 RepID=A0A9N8HB93_9STRA|nr:Phytanoyl-CoA dioxygenase (PhyH) [Seminavis robusta]|eukprot:Sro174_g076820.1 Phytanoyl-CoA dioxygenase (PhyH) (317) ;mRNA; f:85524-86474